MNNKQSRNAKQISDDIINNFEDELIHELVLKDFNNDTTNSLVVDIKYLEDIKELYNSSYISQSKKREFRIISIYNILNNKDVQIEVTDEYKDILDIEK